MKAANDANDGDDEDYYEEEEEYDPMQDPYLRPMVEDDNVLKYIRMYHEFQPLDVHAAFPIIVDLQHLEDRGIDMDCLFCFVKVLLNKHTLQIYDHAGDPRISGYFHVKGESSIHELYRQVAVYAFNWYHDNLPEGKTMQLKEVNRMSCSPDCYPFFHFTFTVVDEFTHQQLTLQAQVIQFAVGDWQLGLLRDASHDRVLASIRFKQAPTGDTYNMFKGQLEDVWDKIML